MTCYHVRHDIPKVGWTVRMPRSPWSPEPTLWEVIRVSRTAKSFWITNGRRTLRVQLWREGWRWKGLEVVVGE